MRFVRLHTLFFFIEWVHMQEMTLSSSSGGGRLDAIRKFIDDKISPGVNSHGGEVLIHSLDSNVLTLSLSGACGNCGIVAYTSESISNYILEEFPDLDDVVVTD
jgi:Fe-S cluster biogenesis protein NfuA